MVYAATPIRATSTSLNPTTLQGWWKQITYYFSKSMLNNQEMWFLIGARKTQDFWRQSVARATATVWNWSGKTLSRRGSSRRSLLFFVPYIFFRPFRLSLAPFICPWVSEDELTVKPPQVYPRYSINTWLYKNAQLTSNGQVNLLSVA